MYLGADPGAKDDGGRLDLPPYQIRIRSKANDSELPNLEYDFQKREISFEWEGMFARFYREAAKQEKREYSILSEATEWLDRGDCSIVGALALTKRNKEARRSSMRDIRRNRVEEWYLKNHDWEFEDRLFDEEEETKALDAIEEFEMHGDFTRCAEDAESRQKAEEHAAKQQMIGMIETMRGLHGPGEMDEDALMDTFTRVTTTTISLKVTNRGRLEIPVIKLHDYVGQQLQLPQYIFGISSAKSLIYTLTSISRRP